LRRNEKKVNKMHRTTRFLIIYRCKNNKNNRYGKQKATKDGLCRHKKGDNALKNLLTEMENRQ
jgi:hypothetical protein